MKNKSRFYHAPVHTHGSTQATKASRALIFSEKGGGRQWIEVFTDVIFAVAIMQVGANAIDAETSQQQILAVGLTIWTGLAWFFHVVYANRFVIDDFLHRILVFGHLFCFGLLTALAPALLKGDYHNFTLFAVIAEGLAGAIYLRSIFHVTGRIARYCIKRAGIYFLLGGIWLASTQLPDLRYELWTLAFVLSLITPFLIGLTENHRAMPLSRGHLAQRFGIFVTILLGGAVVQVFLRLYAVAGPNTSVKPAAVSLILVFSLWWLYIDDIAKAIIRRGLKPLTWWLIGHVLLCSCIIALRVSLENFTHVESFAPGYSQLLAVALGGFLLATGIIDGATTRVNSTFVNTMRVSIRIGSGAIIFLVGMTFKEYGGFWLHALCIFIVFCQIAFDLLYSPYTQAEEGIIASTASVQDPEEARARLRFDDHKDAKKTLLSEPVKVGVPPSAGSDIYYYFVESSWSKLVLALVIIYLGVNIVFAVLYLIYPNSVAGGSLNAFLDAFFFSVQTMSTIGFGQLTPNGHYSNFIVTIEAAVGLIGTAMVTGLVFAKISRPQAKVIFSNNVLINHVNGKRTLTLRLGNTRGNDLIEARVYMSVLKQEETEEGELINRVYSLKLLRDTSPTMRLTWNLFHEIDEDSPFYDWVQKQDAKADGPAADDAGTKEEAANDDMAGMLGIFVIVTGHDGTYSNTIHARKSYGMDDVLMDRYFTDIVSRMHDGRAMINFNYFHELKPNKRGKSEKS